MKTYKEIPREIPIIAEASILIVGGGPAGFGAFAITVKPPPVTAPATTAYFNAGEKFGTSVDK